LPHSTLDDIGANLANSMDFPTLIEWYVIVFVPVVQVICSRRVMDLRRLLGQF
jgi:hypothetical protein